MYSSSIFKHSNCLFLQPPLPGHGQGRLSVLDQPVTVATAIQKMKSHLGLSHLRLALGVGHTQGEDTQTTSYYTGIIS